jgi:hypothetical protein
VLSVHPLLHPALRREYWASEQFEVTKRLHKGYASEVYKVCGVGWGDGEAPIKGSDLCFVSSLPRVRLCPLVLPSSECYPTVGGDHCQRLNFFPSQATDKQSCEMCAVKVYDVTQVGEAAAFSHSPEKLPRSKPALSIGTFSLAACNALGQH